MSVYFIGNFFQLTSPFIKFHWDKFVLKQYIMIFVAHLISIDLLAQYPPLFKILNI